MNCYTSHLIQNQLMGSFVWYKIRNFPVNVTYTDYRITYQFYIHDIYYAGNW